jgi:putative ABC transport system permease protein
MRSRLRLADLPALATLGLRTRRTRAALSALGVAIGIACIVSVLGLTASSQAALLAEIDRLGTNMLTVTQGRALGGDEVPLPATAPTMITRVDGVTAMAPTAELRQVYAYRNDLVASVRTGSLSVRACDGALMSTLEAILSQGSFLTDGLPVAVLGSDAAAHLGSRGRIWVSGHWLTVVGVLRPLPLAPEVNRSVLIGFPTATRLYGWDGTLSRIYLRAATDRVLTTAALLARTANPANPSAVEVSRPSDALTARLAVARSGTSLFLGLGAVALLVGAVGIANVMVIAVLERRGEIGLRRAIGARRRHIAAQYLGESVLLAFLGGIAGSAIGAAITLVAARGHDWTPTLPALALWGGPAVAAIIGAAAGLYPAIRAAHLAPTDALRTR